MFKSKKFRFSGEKTVISALAALLCYAMGYWQFTRFQEKRVYFAEVERQEAKGVQAIDPNREDWSEWRYATVRLSGEFDYEREMVLTNRSMANTPGVRVVTPLRLTDGGPAVLVDRGFLPYDRYVDGQRERFQPGGERTVEGVLRPSKTKTFFLAPEQRPPESGEWRERWLRLEIEAMTAQLPYQVAPLYVEQTNQAGEYPVYDPKTVMSAGRHLNYAIQWASFGTFSLFLGLFFQFRRKPQTSENQAAAAPI